MPGWGALPVCAVLALVPAESACAQALTSALLTPVRDGFVPPEQLPLRRTAQAIAPDATKKQPVPRGRNGAVTYDIPAASGAAVTGFDSLNRKRLKPKLYPGAPKPKIVGPGNRPGASAPSRPARVAAPVAPAVAGTVAGQPPRRRLKWDDDPFGQIGLRTGSFLTKAAVEVGVGHDSNPGRLAEPRGSAFYRVAPELLIASDWSRHSLIADLRGSFTGYGTTFPLSPETAFVPTRIDRPDFTGKVDGRIDVSRDTRINAEARLRIFTDNPGSPNIQTGLSRYPLATAFGGTAGVEHDINRLRVSVAGLADRTVYQQSQLTDGTVSSNDDRNFDQYGGLARVSYDLMPGLRPFGEVSLDTRVHDLKADRAGYLRDSNGGYVKAGTTFEFSRLLTGEAAVGYARRTYQDARLDDLKGLLTSASLVWTVTGLTTVRFDATSSIDETTLPGVSGTVTRDYALQVDHAFRRWLIGTAKIGTGTSDYDGARFDRRYFVEGDLVYKLSRTFHLKGQVRHDWLQSTAPGATSSATVVMLGLRVQR